MRKNKKNNMTTEEDDNMTTSGCHQRTTEMSAEERWGFPFEMGKEMPRSKMIARVERNTETGTQTNVTREEEDLKRSPEERWNHPSGEEQSTTGDIQGTGLGKTENDVHQEPTFVQDRRC